MDNNAQPTFDTPSAMGGPPPDLGTPTQPQVQVQPQQAPAPQPTQQDISVGHDSLFGRAAKTLMGGNTSYHVDQNGNTVAVQSGNSFAQFAKNVLAASLLGAAAGANGDKAQGITGGLARGAGAAVGQQEHQDQLKRQQAEQQFKDQEEAQQSKRLQEQADQQKLQSQATVAHMHALTANMQRTSDLADAELHQKNNASSRALEGVLIQAGGKLAPIPVDGKPSNGVLTAPQMAEAVVSNPNVMKAPEGYERHFLDTSDASDVKFNGKQWVQDDGTPVNMTDKTTIKAYDVPIDSLNTRQDLKGSVLLAANPSLKGTIDPDKTYPTTPTQVTALRASYMGEQQKQALVDQEKARTRVAQGELNVKQRELALKEHPNQNSLSGSDLSHLVTPENVGPDGINHSFLSNVEQQDPKRAGLIKQIGEGRAIISSFGLSRKEGQALGEDVAAAYPGYDHGRAQQYEKTVSEFGPAGKAGKTLIHSGTAFEHLERLYNSVGALQTQPGLKTIGDYIQHDKSGQFATSANNAASEIATAYANGGVPHKDEIAGYHEAYNGNPAKVRSAVVQQAKNLMDKVKETADAYDSSVPSTFVRPQTFLSPSAAAAYTKLTGEPVDPKLVRHADIIGQKSPQNGHDTSQAAIAGQRDGEVPVTHDGKVIGFTMPGKSGMRPIQ